MHFQIYLPGINGDGSKALTECGLPHLAIDANWVTINGGPDGKAGALGFWNDESGYKPELTDWIPEVLKEGVTSQPRYWVGVRKDSPPTPRELAFRNQFPGSQVELGDGRKWTFPAGGMLPRNFKLDPSDGRVLFVVKKEFEDFFLESERWYRLLVLAEVESGQITIDGDWWNYLYRALSMNYRLLPELVSHLELLDTRVAIAAAVATVDGHSIRTVEEALKKNAPVGISDGSSIGPG